MKYQNILINSLKESFILIWKNKPLFALLFILQIIFFIIFSFINISYQTKILESAKAITDYINQQKLDDVSIASNILQKKSILGDDPLSISRNFNDIIKNFRLYLIYAFVLLIIFASLAWAITNKLVYKTNFKKLLGIFFNIFVVLLFYLGIIFWFFFSISSISFTEAAYDSSKIFAKYILFLIISAILAYFMFVSLSLLHKTSLKNIVQKTLSVGIKKAHYVFAVYFIDALLFCMSIALLYYFIEENLFILFLSLMLMVFSFVFGRILLINVVDRLEKD